VDTAADSQSVFLSPDRKAELLEEMRYMKNQVARIIFLFVVIAVALLIVTGCSALGGGAEPTTAPQLANPASVNCVEQGGTVSIETRPDGGQYGVCLFEDNMQCEEFALLRGDCPVGGIRVTGYVTDAARYCAITGGTYTATGGTTSDGQEAGTCSFSDGATCDVFEFYSGTCSPGDN
jgi:putative hemolysin